MGSNNDITITALTAVVPLWDQGMKESFESLKSISAIKEGRKYYFYPKDSKFYESGGLAAKVARNVEYYSGLKTLHLDYASSTVEKAVRTTYGQSYRDEVAGFLKIARDVDGHVRQFFRVLERKDIDIITCYKIIEEVIKTAGRVAEAETGLLMFSYNYRHDPDKQKDIDAGIDEFHQIIYTDMNAVMEQAKEKIVNILINRLNKAIPQSRIESITIKLSSDDWKAGPFRETDKFDDIDKQIIANGIVKSLIQIRKWDAVYREIGDLTETEVYVDAFHEMTQCMENVVNRTQQLIERKQLSVLEIEHLLNELGPLRAMLKDFRIKMGEVALQNIAIPSLQGAHLLAACAKIASALDQKLDALNPQLMEAYYHRLPPETNEA